MCDSSSDAVDFYAVHAGVPHALRQHAHEIANAAGGFQDIAFAESHIFQCFVHRLDDGGRGVKGVQRGRPRRVKFLRGQRVQKLPVFIFPGGIIRFKGFLHAAPANIARQRFLFFRRRQPPLRLNAFEQKDGFHVHAEPGLGAARAEAGVGNMKIVALRFRRRGNLFLLLRTRRKGDDGFNEFERRIFAGFMAGNPRFGLLLQPALNNGIRFHAGDGIAVFTLEIQVAKVN